MAGKSATIKQDGAHHFIVLDSDGKRIGSSENKSNAVAWLHQQGITKIKYVPMPKQKKSRTFIDLSGGRSFPTGW